jgi:hypothetical protein
MINTASTAMNQASQATDEKETSDCEKMKQKNREQRDQVKENLTGDDDRNQEEDRTLAKAEGTGMTFSSAISRVPGASTAPGGSMTACSSGCAQACSPNELAQGGTSEQKLGLNKETRESDDPKHDEAKEKAGVLCGGSYVHPGGGKGAHAEPKIINQLMQDNPGAAMEGGSILLNIDWRFKQRNGANDSSGMPCRSCYAMLCHAATKCKIEIFLCDKDGKEQPLSSDDCKNEDGYSELSKRIDGNPTPGRGSFTGPHP